MVNHLFNSTSILKSFKAIKPVIVPTQLHVFGRCFSTLNTYDPTKRKITELRAASNPMTAILFPMQQDWEPIHPLKIKPVSRNHFSTEGVHYFCGGLPALLQAVRKVENLVEKKSSDQVVYVNDGLIPKSLQSGHQAHVHPSEWSADDCSVFNLSKAILRGIGLFPEQDPKSTFDYSYLHFPFSFSQFSKQPMKHISLYAKFFRQRIFHNLTQVNGVSNDDRWLCNSIVESLQFHKILSGKIEKQQGYPSFTQCGRAYWSPNFEAMKKKEKTWKELGIDCEFISSNEVRRTTLLKDGTGLHVLKIHDDGKFYPDTMTRIIRYLQDNFPQQFKYFLATADLLQIDKQTSCPLNVRHILKDGTIQTIAVKTFFSSLGHNRVSLKDKAGKTKPLWLEVPVSGNSTVWRCTVKKEELQNRFGTKLLNKQQFEEALKSLLPLANLSNLHVTTWGGEVHDQDVIFELRVSQGANFNSWIANKQDLINMSENLNKYLIGNWELLSAGTCSRKTYLSNVPEYVELSSNPKRPATFLHGLSGIGYSFSGASLATIKQRPPKS